MKNTTLLKVKTTEYYPNLPNHLEAWVADNGYSVSYKSQSKFQQEIIIEPAIMAEGARIARVFLNSCPFVSSYKFK